MNRRMLAIIAIAIALLASSCGTAFAAKKPKPVYQDGVLKDFRTEQQGTYCSTNGDTNGTVRARTDDDGNTHGTVDANTTASTSCSPRVVAFYTVVVGEHTFVLSPIPKPISIGKMLIPFAGPMMAVRDAAQNSVLYGLLPGTPIQMVNKDGTIYIKVGKNESEFTIVSMK